MRTWSVLQVPEGDEFYRYEVEVAEVPWWALAVSHFIEFVDARTGHLLCGSSVGHDLVGWALALPDAHAHQLQRFSVPAEVGATLRGGAD